MKIQRPRGEFTLETTLTQRVDSETANRMQLLRNQQKGADKATVERLDKEIERTRLSGLKSYPFLAKSDLTPERMAEFLSSSPEDSDIYSMWDELGKIVAAHLRIKFQAAWFDAAKENKVEFLEIMEEPSFSGYQETSAGCLLKAAKASKAKDNVSVVKLMQRAQELMSQGR